MKRATVKLTGAEVDALLHAALAYGFGADRPEHGSAVAKLQKAWRATR